MIRKYLVVILFIFYLPDTASGSELIMIMEELLPFHTFILLPIGDSLIRV